jgi:hypothetical protein
MSVLALLLYITVMPVLFVLSYKFGWFLAEMTEKSKKPEQTGVSDV